MAFEREFAAEESGFAPETEERPASTADYLISAKTLARKMMDRGRRQAEEILQGANTQAEEILQGASTQAEEILRGANAQAEEILRGAEARAQEITTQAEERAEKLLDDARREADGIRSGAMPEAVHASTGDQEHAVRCVEACFEKLRQQHLEAIDQINAQWREFLCGLFTGEDRPEEEVPADLTERVSAIADAMEAFEREE